MYTPSAFVETDLAELDKLLAHDSFVSLVSTEAGVPHAAHLPVLYSREGDRILIEGHWAKPNPQVKHTGNVLMIVHGPHAYISPSWYVDKEEAARVPTWNYAVAHLSGKLEVCTDESFLASVVARLSQSHEAAVGSDWRYEHDRADHRKQLRGIVGFRFVPDRIELKFKLSQNHPPENILGAAEGLQRQGHPSHEVAALMLDRLARTTQG